MRRAAAAGALCTLGLAAHLLSAYQPGVFGFTLFTDRDLSRALRWRDELPLWGPETTGGAGARLPGAALGVAYALGAAIRPDPAGAFLVVLAGFTATALVAYVAGMRLGGPWLGLVIAGLTLTSPVALSALGDLWNPSFVPLPVAVAAWGVGEVVAGRRRGLAVAAAGVAVGAQLHGSVAVWGLAALPGLVVAAPAAVARGAPAALLAVLLAFLPTLVGAAVVGAPPGTLGGSETVWLADAARPLACLRWGIPRLFTAPLDGPPSATEVGAWWPSVGMATVGAVAAAVRGGAVRGAALVAASQLLLGLGLLGLGGRADPPDRYLLPGMPAVLVLVALGLDAVRDVATRVGARARDVASIGLLALLLPRLGVHGFVWLGADPMTWASVEATADALRRRTGWTDGEVSSRAAWMAVPRAGEPAVWEHFPALDHRLAAMGLRFEGSGTPPCALLLRGAPTPFAPTPEEVTRWLGARRPVLRVEAPEDLGTGWVLVRYEPASQRCPTSMSQRYVPLPEERVAREAWDRLPGGGAETHLLASGVRFVAHLADCSLPLDSCGSTIVVLDLRTSPEALRVRLSSNQLRGIADNEGWYSATALEAPTVVLTRSDDGAERRVVLDSDVVGHRYALPPLTQDAEPLTPGTWSARLEARWFAEDWQDPTRRVVDGPVAVDLGTLVVP